MFKVFGSIFLVVTVSGLIINYQSSPSVVNPMLVETGSLAHGQLDKEKKNISANNLVQPPLPDNLKNSSLKGTDIDGLYPVDENGNLILSNAIKHRFEYFLSTMGEFDLDHVLQMVKDDIQLNLASPAKEQAMELFDNYVAYKYALSKLEHSLQSAESYNVNDTERMRHQLQMLRDVRREYLAEEAVDAFFGFDEMYDDFMLSQLDIKNSRQLSSVEKQQQLKSLEENLPHDVRLMRDETQRISELFEITKEMKASGADEEEIYQTNAHEFGIEAAERLQKLNQERDQWQERVNGFLIRKGTISKDAELSVEEKDKQIDVLRQTNFSEKEQSKLRAYELMQLESNR